MLCCKIVPHDHFEAGSVLVRGGIAMDGHTDIGTLTAIGY